MGIYIKGMEMPKSCFDCPFMYGRKYCSANSKIEFNDPDYSELKRRYDGCPLVHVPPHGRLGDLDELYKEALRRSETKDGYYNCLDLVISCYTIDHAPTIIEADTAEERHEKESS